MRKLLIGVFFVILGVIFPVECLRFPSNPCPNYFSYVTQTNGPIYGQIQAPYDGRTKNLRLNVNASMLGVFNQVSMKIELENAKDEILGRNLLTFNVYFPLRNILPKITNIEFNGATLCSGPQEQITEMGVTNLWATFIYVLRVYTVQQEVDMNAASPNFADIVPVRRKTTTSRPFVNPQNPFFNNNSNVDSPSTFAIEPERRKTSTSRPFVNPQNPFFNNSNFDSPSTFDRPRPTMSNNFEQKETPTTEKNLRPSTSVSTPTSMQDVLGVCGVENSAMSLVIGGQMTQQNQFPWVVAMMTNSEQDYKYKCNANLISHKHVVTAAQCVQFYKVQIVKTEDILFILGKSDLSRWATSDAETRRAKKVMVHPDHKQYTGTGDLALIELDRPVQFSRTVRPICLWKDLVSLVPLVDRIGKVSGWGQKAKNGASSVPILNTISMPVVSQEQCLRSNAAFRNLTSETTFCAGDRRGSGPCMGDSGAGFMVQNDDREKRWYLRGLVSIAISSTETCQLDQYVIFCDVAKYTEWLKLNM